MLNPKYSKPKGRTRDYSINPQVLLNVEFSHPLKWTGKTLPALHQVQPPRFKEGERLRWRETDDSTDWGIVIGRFYNYALHSHSWEWCYLIWLDPHSKSAAWCQWDTAWEEDLERLDDA